MLQDLKEFSAETMAQLEVCFLPGYFDITENLMIHIIDQIQVLGPLYLHEIWTYERFMSILNRYVLNRAHPVGSMIEGYNTEEVIESCLGYLKDIVSLGLPIPCFLGGRKLWAQSAGKSSSTKISKVCNKHIIAFHSNDTFSRRTLEHTSGTM